MDPNFSRIIEIDYIEIRRKQKVETDSLKMRLAIYAPDPNLDKAKISTLLCWKVN